MSEGVHRIWERLLHLVGLSRVTLVDDSGPVQQMQVQFRREEVRDNVPRLTEYGFQSNPPAGCDAVVLHLGGDRSSGIVIATGSQQYRLTGLASGEVAISDNRGQKVYLTQAGIVVEGGGLPMTFRNAPSALFDIPSVRFTGNVQIDGTEHVDGTITSDISVTALQVFDQNGAKSMAGMRAAYNEHHHGASVSTDTPM
jgi:phage baseplate assembly protein V